MNDDSPEAYLRALVRRCKPEDLNRAYFDYAVARQGDSFQMATYYQPDSQKQQQRITRVLNAVGSAPGPALDLGSGSGTFTYHLSRQGRMTCGVDYSPVSIRTAARLHRQFAPAGSWAFLISRSEHLPLRDRAFPLVVTADFIEHLTTAQKAATLAEIRRLLAPGGRVIIGTPNVLVEKRTDLFERLRGRYRDNPERAAHIGSTHPRALRRAIRAAGLRVIACHYYIDHVPLLSRIIPAASHRTVVYRRLSQVPALADVLADYFVVIAATPDPQ